ncbi:hypothetical protein ACWF94_27485 [Streptomyces sp. NPDC055078]
MVIGRGGRVGQLLLLVALLFGIATMHTVGHPSASAAPAHGPGHTAPPPAGGSGQPGSPAVPGAGAVPLPAAAAVRAPQAPPADPVPPAPGTRTAGTVHTTASGGSAHADSAAPAPGSHQATGQLAEHVLRAQPVGADAADSRTERMGRTGHIGPDQAAAGTGTGAGDTRPAPSDGQGQGHGMDPGAVCLAVLGWLGAALLVMVAGGLPGRRTGEPAGGSGRGRIVRGPWAGPPPVIGILAKVSVLRI